MSLIDRYIAEVGRHLPEKDRADIEAEIRSMLEDMLDEHSERRRQTGQPVDDTAIAEVLEELGDPRALAAKYAPTKRYLIGPGWYEAYTLTLKRILYIALPVYAAVTILPTLAANPLDFANAFGRAFGGVFGVGLQALFWVTIVFVFLERFAEIPEQGHGAESRKWTIAQLPKLPPQGQISLGEALTDIVMDLFVLLWVVLPLIRNWLLDDSNSVSFFHPDLRTLWLPAFLVLIVLTLIHDVFKLKIGAWTPGLTVTNVILCLASIVYIVALVTTQQVINPAFLAALAGAQSDWRNATAWSTWTVNFTAAILTGILLWDMFNSIRMSKRLNNPPGMVVLKKNVS